MQTSIEQAQDMHTYIKTLQQISSRYAPRYNTRFQSIATYRN